MVLNPCPLIVTLRNLIGNDPDISALRFEARKMSGPAGVGELVDNNVDDAILGLGASIHNSRRLLILDITFGILNPLTWGYVDKRKDRSVWE